MDMDGNAERAPETGNAPVIISRKDHTISRRLIDPEALKVLYRLSNSGYLAYLVGGGVRDLLLGKKPKDFDIATDARPEQVRRLFRNSRIIGRRFRLAHVFFHGGKIVEVSTFRRSVVGTAPEDEPTIMEADALIEDVESLPGGEETTEPCEVADDADPTTESVETRRARPDENHYGTPEEDARRRDITINALFYNIADFSIIDYVGGMDDLRNGVIRSVGCPHRSIQEDPVRMIRVIRHAARTGFRIEPATYEAVCLHAPKIVECSPARVREEFLRDLRGGASQKSFHLMAETGLLHHLFSAYESVLRGPDGERTRECLLRNLAGIDCLNKRGKCLSDPMLLAAFVAPFVRHERIMERAPEGRQCIGYFHQEVREIIKPIVRNFGFSKAHAEGISQTVIGMLLMEFSEEDGSPLPRSLVNKAYFGDGYTLYCVECEGRGRDVPHEFRLAARRWESRFLQENPKSTEPCDREQPSPSRRRRRRRRPSRPVGPETAV